jgi:hypothetical protein
MRTCITIVHYTRLLVSDERNPWSIRGVSREARARAAKAARRRRMTMGAWVDYVLTAAANAELSSRAPQGVPEQTTPAPHSADDLAGPAATVEEREQALRAMVQRAAERALVPSEPAMPPQPVMDDPTRPGLTDALYGLVQHVEIMMRPATQIGALARRLDEADTHQVKMLELMACMVEADQRREADMGRLAAALTRLEARPGGPNSAPSAPSAPDLARLATYAERPTADAPSAQALDFAAVTDRAIANSQRAGQRPPAGAGGLADRLFGPKRD